MPFVTRHSSFVTRHSSLVIRHSSFVTRHSSSLHRHLARHAGIGATGADLEMGPACRAIHSRRLARRTKLHNAIRALGVMTEDRMPRRVLILSQNHFGPRNRERDPYILILGVSFPLPAVLPSFVPGCYRSNLQMLLLPYQVPEAQRRQHHPPRQPLLRRHAGDISSDGLATFLDE